MCLDTPVFALHSAYAQAYGLRLIHSRGGRVVRGRIQAVLVVVQTRRTHI